MENKHVIEDLLCLQKQTTEVIIKLVKYKVLSADDLQAVLEDLERIEGWIGQAKDDVQTALRDI